MMRFIGNLDTVCSLKEGVSVNGTWRILDFVMAHRGLTQNKLIALQAKGDLALSIWKYAQEHTDGEGNIHGTFLAEITPNVREFTTKDGETRQICDLVCTNLSMLA